MELIIVTLIVVLGFSAITHLYLQHISRLELLIKAEKLHEVHSFEGNKITAKKPILAEPEVPETLSEAAQDKGPDFIRNIFRRSTPAD